MFQVASHPPSFNMHIHGSHYSAHYSAPSSPNVQLPRNLARPSFAEVSRDSIIAAAPELSNVPVEYIRRGLRPKATQYVLSHRSPFTWCSTATRQLECLQASPTFLDPTCRPPYPVHNCLHLFPYQCRAPRRCTQHMLLPCRGPNPRLLTSPS